jgi:hypothetical protein
MTARIRSTGRTLAAALALLLAQWISGAAQQSSTVALFPVALYNAQANVQEPTDAAKAILASEVLRSKLHELLGARLLDSASVEKAARAPRALDAAAGRPCNVVVTCARDAARAAGARWVVMAKVSKTSNLIWLFTGQLIDAGASAVVNTVDSAESADSASVSIILDDSTELKGDPEPMVRAGARIFAERVARAVRAGGKISNFPGEP